MFIGIYINERVVADTDVMQVLEAIGNSVRPKGRVDLLGCRLDATAAGKAFLSKLSKQCGVQFAAKDDKRMVMGGGFGGTGGPSSPRAPVADSQIGILLSSRGAARASQLSVDNLAGAQSMVRRTDSHRLIVQQARRNRQHFCTVLQYIVCHSLCVRFLYFG